MTPRVGASVAATAHLPSITRPVGDPVTIRRHGTRLASGADGLGQVAWRLQADRAAMRAARRWCGPASTAFDVACGAHADRLVAAARVVSVASQACQRYASALADVQARSQVDAAWADRLVRERDELDAARVRLWARQSAAVAALPSPLQLGSLFAEQPALIAEQHRLAARETALAADVGRLERQSRACQDAAATAAAELAALFTELVGLTTAARDGAAAARHDALVAAGELSAEDSSAGSRLGGFVEGLWSDVTGPVDLFAGLVGVHGDLPGHWRALRDGLADEVTHPLRMVGDAVDLQDVRQGDWGQWLGSELPGFVSFGAGDALVVARALRSADLFATSTHMVQRLRHAQDLIDEADAAQFLERLGGQTTSVLVPGGGLAGHEAAGGHALDRHVALTVAQLHARLRRYGVPSASTFFDRTSAEAAVVEALTIRSAAVAQWLGGRGTEVAFRVDVGHVVGMTLRRGASAPVPATQVKVVLRRAPGSPVGFVVLTAFPVP